MDDEIDLLEYWRVIVKRKWMILGLTLILLSCSLVYNKTRPTIFQSTATIMSVESGGGGLGSALSAVGIFGGGGGGGGYGQYIPILKSKTLASLVAQNVVDKNLDPNRLRGAVQAKVGDGLLNVTVVWPRPGFSVALANEYVAQLGKFLNTRSLNLNFQVIDPAVDESSYRKNKIPPLNSLFGSLIIGVVCALAFDYLAVKYSA